jgi:uncharacterized membrane protein YfcA
MPELSSILIAGLAVACGACLQGTIGFGLGLLATPIVALVDPAMVPGPLIMVAGLLTLLVLRRDRDHVDLRGVGWALAGRVPGTVLGALAVAALPERPLLVTLGLLILAAVAMSVAGRVVARSAKTLLLAGAVSGVMATAASIGGPPIALAYQDASGPLLRGTLSAFFLVGSVLSLASLAVFGEFGGQQLVISLLLVPFMLVGNALAPLATRRLDPARTRAVVLTVSTLSAVLLLTRELAGL